MINSNFDILTCAGATLTTIGAIFLLRSIIGMGAKEIANMSGTYIGSNSHLENSYVELKCDTFVGFLITIFGGLTATISTVINLRPDLNKENIILFILSSLTVFILGHILSKVMQKYLRNKTKAITFAHHVESYLQYNYNSFDAEKLIEDAMNFGLSFLIDERLDSYNNLTIILEFAGATPGAKEILKIRERLPVSKKSI